MRKPDLEVREVLCSDTGKPMPKIPMWMAGIKVKFVSDEARQKHPTLTSMADLEPSSRTLGGDLDELKALGAVVGAVGDEEEEDIEDVEADPEAADDLDA